MRCREATNSFHLEQRYLAEMRQPGDLGTTAVLWHPFRNELVTSNTLGHIQVLGFAVALQSDHVYCYCAAG